VDGSTCRSGIVAPDILLTTYARYGRPTGRNRRCWSGTVGPGIFLATHARSGRPTGRNARFRCRTALLCEESLTGAAQLQLCEKSLTMHQKASCRRLVCPRASTGHQCPIRPTDRQKPAMPVRNRGRCRTAPAVREVLDN